MNSPLPVLTQYLNLSASARSALGNTSWMLVEKATTMTINLLVTLILARSLGPNYFGLLSFYLALLLLVGPITSMGMNAIVTREIVNHPALQRKIMSTTTLFRFLGGLVGNALIFTWALVFADFNKVELQLFAVLAVSNILYAFQVVEFFFQAQVAIRYVSMMRALNVFIFGLCKLAAVLLDVSFTGIALIFACEFICLSLGFIVLYQWKGEGLSLRAIDFTYGRQLLHSTFWLILSGVSALVYLKIDQVMLGSLVSYSEAGIYAVAARLSEVWYFISDALVLSFFAMLLTQKNENPQLYDRNLQKLCDGLFATAALIAIGVTVVAKPAILLLFGEEYFASANILVVHIWAGLFVFMRALASKWMIAENIFIYSLVSDGMGAIFNVLLNLLLIPKFGGMGAAWATIISYATASWLGFWIFPQTRFVARLMTQSLLLPLTAFKRYWPASNRN